MKIESTNIDWRLVPSGTRVSLNDDEYVIDAPYDGTKLAVSRTVFNEALKRNEKDGRFIQSNELSNLNILNVPERLYPKDLKSAKTLLEVISEQSLLLGQVSPLTSSEIRFALTFQLYKKTKHMVCQCNDTLRIVPIDNFSASINPNNISISFDGGANLNLEVPNRLLHEAIKQVILYQAI